MVREMQKKTFLINYFIGILIIGIIVTSCIVFLNYPKKLTQSENPLTRLIEGNKRFQKNGQLHPDESFDLRTSISGAQYPFAVVVCCSDSRVPPELVFDQGFGDLFVIRTAGNIVDSVELGSIEYAVEHLSVKQIIVLGHESCGAIKAFVDHKEVKGNMKKLIEYIGNEKEESEAMEQPASHIHNCVIANVRHVENSISSAKPILSKKFYTSEIKIIGAVYNLVTGDVTFLE